MYVIHIHSVSCCAHEVCCALHFLLCTSFVRMKCVNCYFISNTIYIKLQYVYAVCSIIGRGVWRVVWGAGASGGRARGGV